MPKFSEAFHKKASQLCAGIEPEDGSDPRFDKKDRGKPQNRKALQLCSQVFRCLSLALPSAGCLLPVESVELAPDSSQLLVTLQGYPDTDELDVLHYLAEVKGELRSEVAQSIHRRKTPRLLFKIVKPCLYCSVEVQDAASSSA